jgi:hypothetical protein
MEGKVCAFEGCGRKLHGSTYCNGHYLQAKKGQVLKTLRVLYWASSGMSELDRFLKKVQVGAKEECWPWLAGRKKDWYGNWHNNGNTEGAHRASWRLMRGPIPGGLFVLHHCDNPICVNPEHLFLGTQKTNLHDMDQKKRSRRVGKKGSQHGNSKITEAQAEEIRLSELTPKQLAEKYGISRSMIYHIISGYCWKHI